MPRHLLPLLAFFIAISAKSQKSPPAPKATSPPYKTNDYKSYDTGPGFHVISIPIYGNLELGMEKSSFDTLETGIKRKTELQTVARAYQAYVFPTFTNRRLLTLQMTTVPEELDSIPTDITRMFISKYSTPDSVNTGTETITVGAADSTGNGTRNVYRAELYWRFIYYNVEIHMSYTLMPDRKYYGTTKLVFTGNSSYEEMLKLVD
jgi:hypothetical protein